MASYHRNTGLANGIHGGEQMSLDFHGFTVLPYHGEPQEDIDSLKLMQNMYGGRDIINIRQPSLSSSYCSPFSSSSPSEYLMGDSSINSIAGIGRTDSAQVSSMLNEDMVMSNPSSSTPITMSAKSFNQLDDFNEMAGDYSDWNGGTSAGTAGAMTSSFQLNKREHPGPSLVSNDQNPRVRYLCCSDIAPYFTSTSVADSSSPLPFLAEPITPQQEIHYHQAYIDQTDLSEPMVQSLQCAYNASCNGELDESHGMSLQSHAHEIGGLGCSLHDEKAKADVQHTLGLMSLPFLKCAETSQISASQNNNQQPEWGTMYSNNDIYYGRHRSAQCAAHDEVSGGAMYDDVSTVLLAGPAAAFTQGNISINKEIISTASEANYYDTFSHNHIPNYDEGVQIGGLETGLAPSTRAPASATNNAGDYNSADKADDQRLESIRRINELIKRGSSGQSNMMQAPYTIIKSSGVQDQRQEMSCTFANCNSDMNNSDVDTPQNEAATLHMIAERKRRRKHGDCIKILSTLVPTITKKKDKVTILEKTIEYIKEMKVLGSKPEKGKVSLGNRSTNDYEGEMENSCNSKHSKVFMKSSQNVSSKTNATCEYIHSSSGQEVVPHFELCLNSSVNNLNANVPIMEIISALQKKSLHCIHFRSEFPKSTSCFVVKIMATYKDGVNCTPNMDEIEHIKQWWTHLITNQLSPKWKF